MKALDRKLWRELRQLRGQTVAIALVLVAGIATLVMSLTAYRALHDTRERFYAGHRFAEVFAPVVRAPWPLLADSRTGRTRRSSSSRAWIRTVRLPTT